MRELRVKSLAHLSRVTVEADRGKDPARTHGICHNFPKVHIRVQNNPRLSLRNIVIHFVDGNVAVTGHGNDHQHLQHQWMRGLMTFPTCQFCFALGHAGKGGA